MHIHDRVANRIQLSSDGLKWYFHAVSYPFGKTSTMECLQKSTARRKARFATSPWKLSGVNARRASGIPILNTSRVTPAMAAGGTNRPWEVSDFVALLEEERPRIAA
jgi:hypothetical protein